MTDNCSGSCETTIKHFHPPALRRTNRWHTPIVTLTHDELNEIRSFLFADLLDERSPELTKRKAKMLIRLNDIHTQNCGEKV